MSKQSKNSARTLQVVAMSRGGQKPQKHGRGPRKGPKPGAAQAAPKPRKHKGLLSTALDAGEAIAGFLPGAIKGIRGMFNAKEASFATPASFASVRNNITQMHAEERVVHPQLGLSGYRVRGSQPLCDLNTSTGPGPQDSFFRGDLPALSTTNTILLNPILLAGPLSVHGYLNDRFVIRQLVVRFTTYVSTGTVGVCGLCIEKDPTNLTATGFNTVRQVTPNVTFPYRIPKAELDYVYDGPDLFYCNQRESSGSLAEDRQDFQAVLVGYDPILYPLGQGGLMGFVDIEYVIDFFDPVSPAALIGITPLQRSAMHELRKSFFKSQERLKPNFPDGKAALKDLVQELGEQKEDSDLPVVPAQPAVVTITVEEYQRLMGAMSPRP